MALHETRDGALWIGTGGGGLNRLERGADPGAFSFTRFTAENSALDGSVIMSILEDEEGQLWLGQWNGRVAHFNPETGHVRYFGERHGLPIGAFLYSAALRSQDGTLYWGNTSGLITLRLEDLPPLGEAPRVYLNELLLFNEVLLPGPTSPLERPLSQTQVVHFTHDQNDVTFGFVGLHYTQPEENRYQYRLLGYDSDWRAETSQRRATYTNLVPGEYTFEVKASNSDGVWSDEAATLRVVIVPPWWKRWWAYLLYGLLFFSSLYAVRRYELNRQRLKHGLELEKVESEKLKELDRMKSRFFANISHEFRTPLTLLLGPLNDALSGDRNPDGLLRQAPFMHRSARRLLRLINQLLDLSKLEAGGLHVHLQPTDLGPFVRRLVAAFSTRAYREGLTLLYDGPSEGALVTAVDRDKLEKVVTNLLSNALKFTPHGGEVRVALRATPYEPANREHAPEGWAELVVEDTGHGIPPEALPMVFDRFYQVDSSATRAHEGTGIGLALTKELVELHDGEINVQSTVGAGTRFVVRLPLQAGKAEATATDEADVLSEVVDLEVEVHLEATDTDLPVEYEVAAETEHLSPRACVLVVEDNLDMRAYLSDLLRGEGYRVEEASDGEEGLARARALTPDLAILDIMMPRMDGLALCRAIKASDQLSHVPVVLLTAKAAEDDKLEGLEAGADDYLPKPFSAQELLLRTENLIEIRRRLRRRFSGEVRLGPSEIVVSSQEAVFLEQVRSVVEAELSNSQLTMEQVAEAVGLGLRQLHRRLKAVVGLTPGGYVRMLRLERAAQLLVREAGNVSQVAYAVGFNDVSYFSRLFKQVHGVSPSQYRTTRL